MVLHYIEYVITIDHLFVVEMFMYTSLSTKMWITFFYIVVCKESGSLKIGIEKARAFWMIFDNNFWIKWHRISYMYKYSLGWKRRNCLRQLLNKFRINYLSYSKNPHNSVVLLLLSLEHESCLFLLLRFDMLKRYSLYLYITAPEFGPQSWSWLGRNSKLWIYSNMLRTARNDKVSAGSSIIFTN